MVRTFHHSAFPLERLRTERRDSVSVCLPAREVAATIGPIVHTLARLRDAGAFDQLVVVDAASADGTARIAARQGAEVYQEAELRPGLGCARGKGDAMWRALSVLDGDVVCFLDADTEDFGGHFARGLIGSLCCEPGVEFVKATFRRPFRVGDVALPQGGGRVTELCARPLLRRFYPELADFGQPLAGELGGRRELLERIPFATGYGVEVAMLIDVWREVGLGPLAQVDLDVRQNRHQPLNDLGPMADAVLDAVVARLHRDGRLTADPGVDAPPLERPPLTAR